MKVPRELRRYETRVPPRQCPGCGNKLDAASEGRGEDVKPKPGDFSLCFYCGHYSVFSETLQLRDPTEEEMLEWVSNEIVLDLQRRRKRGWR